MTSATTSTLTSVTALTDTRGDTCARIENAAIDILTLIEGLGPAEYARSRLTRRSIALRLSEITRLAAALVPPARDAMREVDWVAWAALDEVIARCGDGEREWAAASALAEPTLQWMRVYRQVAPGHAGAGACAGGVRLPIAATGGHPIDAHDPRLGARGRGREQAPIAAARVLISRAAG